MDHHSTLCWLIGHHQHQLYLAQLIDPVNMPTLNQNFRLPGLSSHQIIFRVTHSPLAVNCLQKTRGMIETTQLLRLAVSTSTSKLLPKQHWMRQNLIDLGHNFQYNKPKSRVLGLFYGVLWFNPGWANFFALLHCRLILVSLVSI